ncbi:MAG: carboxypeptidase regulatory-like domain-containing protein [Gracilimonas sp.]|uniref:carboxypeptidase-like regulatory domain-containing protein n=1 Tax=Gracilimonas sp. TaxID=1974203 RepID=UPI0019899CD3|nr:carboxypeptidase-like regulatory domain-containing protein [Gracilimonas sp.]MBD3615409.1 carboxypeptidase regulatory-like domain-containing protein [Gracilimonas sp.]
MFRLKNSILSSVFAILFGLVLLPVNSTLQGQTIQASSDAMITISGDVINADNNQPVPGVLVTIVGDVGENKEVESNQRGKFSFNSLSPGKYTLKVDDPRYEEFSKDVELTSQDSNKKITIKLKPA